MPSLGTKIRQERERQGLALDQIAAQTRIRPAYLQAIESDRLEAIPGGFFSRSFVRQYAAFLKMDANQVELELEAMTPKPVDTVRVDKVLTDYRPTTGPVLGMASEGDESEFTTDSSYLRDPKTGMPWIAFATVLIVASVGFLTWQRRPELFSFGAPVSTAAPANPQTQEAASTPASTEPPASAAPVLVEATAAEGSTPIVPSSPLPEPAIPAQAPASAPASAVDFRVSASSDAWIEVVIDGKRAFTGVLTPRAPRNWVATAEARILTGNAGALNVELNGKDIGPVGPRGMVRTIVLSPAGSEIRGTTPTNAPAGTRTPGAAPAPAQ